MRRGVILGVLAIAVSVCFAARAQAATYTVETAGDTVPGTTCSTFPSGCSLRQLIEYENATPSPSDTISVPAGTYDLTQGALVVTASVTIAGAGARSTLVAQTSATPDRVFAVQAPPSAAAPIEPTVTISGLEIAGGMANSNNGYFGGDVLNRGTLTLSEDWITGGTASAGSGGGISNDGGTMTVTHSLVSGNTSTCCGGDSGGIQNYGPNPDTNAAGTLTVDNSTVSNNTAALGGGIMSWGDAKNATVISDSTIAYNDGGTRGTTGGGILSSDGSISVQNSIVADNTVDNPTTATFSNCGTGAGTITSLGYNLETSSDCGFTSTGDLQSTSPQFASGSPQNNGGNTDTFAPPPASPAVDHTPSGASGCGGTDQRDIARPQNGACDIGAVELVPPPPVQPPPVQPPGVPTITSVNPAAGPAAGGTSVTITGTGFSGASAVKFGTANAPAFTVNNANSITATAPAGSAGTVDITVTTAGGTSAAGAGDRFTYVAAPMVVGVSPSTGSSSGGDTVTITGSHLAGAIAVDFGSTAAATFKVISDGQITATSPAGTGTVNVVVKTPGGTSAASSSDLFAYVPQPVITTVATVLSAAVHALSQVNATAALHSGGINLHASLSTPGTLTISITALQNLHVAGDAQIARMLKKGTVLARGKVVARKGGKVKIQLRLTAAGRAALQKLTKALPVQLTANFITPQGVSYTTKRGARIRPRHHAGTVR